MTAATTSRLQAEVRALARERDAVILAHNYQVPEVQDVADYVGDSLGLSRQAAATDAEAIVFCGVHFMAETAKILSPDKTVLIPDLDAGCSLADSITADQLRTWKAEHPGAVVVSYVNTTAEVKAESDYCCTSGNAKAVIDAIPADREILFLPDMFLGIWLERVTGRKLRIWMGECHVHAGIRPDDIERWQREAPDAELLVHPECGCASQCMAFANKKTHILSTEGMVKFAHTSPKERFLVATETGILHRLSKEVPGKRFEAVSERAICRYMKMITLPKLRDSLRDWKHEVIVPRMWPSAPAARSTAWSPSASARCPARRSRAWLRQYDDRQGYRNPLPTEPGTLASQREPGTERPTFQALAGREPSTRHFRSGPFWPTPARGILMSWWGWVLLAAVVVLVLVVVVAAARVRRTRNLRGSFGPEYDRTVATAPSRGAAEAELLERRDRRDRFDIQPLSAVARDRYIESWRAAQASFVDDPEGAIDQADRLIQEAMRERGYPVEDFDRRAADLSVDHPTVVSDYRVAHEVHGASARGQASTEDLRRAMTHYRSLFEELVTTGAEATTGARR